MEDSRAREEAKKGEGADLTGQVESSDVSGQLASPLVVDETRHDLHIPTRML